MTGIVINGRFLTRPPTGVDRFALELLRAWMPRHGERRGAKTLLPGGRNARQPENLDLHAARVGKLRGHAWEQFELSSHCGDDLLLSLCNTGPLTRQRQLAVLHDAAVMARPGTYGVAFRSWYRWLFAGLMQHAGIVATVSKFSAGELMRHVGRRASSIELISGAGEHILRTPADTGVLDRLGIADQTYVLAVGSLTPNKNFEGVVRAAALLRDLDCKIVAAGGANPHVFRSVTVNSDALISAGYVTDGELRALYENAACFVFPSFYEGFGLPPLEAMHCGCPVVVSNRASLPEVCGDAAVYCDPDDPASIAMQLRRVLTSPSLRQELREAGLQRAREFGWDNSAEQLEGLLGGPTSIRRTSSPADINAAEINADVRIDADEGSGTAAEFAPRSILHAAENIKGGVGAYLRDLLSLQASSYGEGVVAALVPASQSAMLQSPDGVEVFTFDDSGPRWLSSLRLASRMHQLLRLNRPSTVHLHSTFAGVTLRPLLRFLHRDISVIYCAHGWAFDRQTSWHSRLIARVVERVLSRWCDHIVCISQHEMSAAERLGIRKSRLHLVTNGVLSERPRATAPDHEVHWPEGKRRVLFVGRFDRQKGVDVLLDAIMDLQDEVFCYLVGDAVLGDSTVSFIPLNARTTGWLPPAQIEAFYRTADVVVVPSRWEGFGLNAVEAMRDELPVIATNVGGLAEIVLHGATGLLIPPNDKAALVRALRDTDDERLAAMGRAGRQRFLRHFTLERVHRELTALYHTGSPRRSRQ